MARRSLAERLWSKVTVGDACVCWPWRGGLIGRPGIPGIRPGSGGEKTSARRLLYEMENGPLPDGHRVYSICHVSRCMNPAHMVADQAGRGEHNTRAVLRDDDVREIRRRHREGESYPRIARDVGASLSAVAFAGRGRNWGHVQAWTPF